MKKLEDLIGGILNVHFFDHTEDHPGIVKCAVIGHLMEVTPTFIRIRSWRCDTSKGILDDHKEWCIVRAAITSIQWMSVEESVEL